jgi:hypothetical protein
LLRGDLAVVHQAAPLLKLTRPAWLRSTRR